MTAGTRNAVVLAVTLLVVGLLMLYPTSTNRPVHHRPAVTPTSHR